MNRILGMELSVENIMLEETAKPDKRQPKETTGKSVAGSALVQSSPYKLTEPGKDFRMTKGGWPSIRSRGSANAKPRKRG